MLDKIDIYIEDICNVKDELYYIYIYTGCNAAKNTSIYKNLTNPKQTKPN